MSGDKKKPDLHESAPHDTEHQEAAQQNGTVDAVMVATKVINPFAAGRGVHFGRTSFEGYRLNEMIDIVESANHELVESAGMGLADARDAINEAADELSRNLGGVDWEGDAHSAFYGWGTDLVTTARDLAGYADTVGTQVMAASAGLASVRKSMPSRDTRTDPKTIDDIPEVQRVDSNADYTAAVKAEQDRQEAINQMYRLASFYTVSGGMMQKAEEPVFPKMPDVGVPEPADLRKAELPRERQSTLGVVGTGSGPVAQHSASAGPAGALVDRSLAPTREPDGSIVRSNENVGTKVDSVGALPAQENLGATPLAPSPAMNPGSHPVVSAPAGFIPVSGASSALGQPRRAFLGGGVPAAKEAPPTQGRADGVTGRPQTGRTGAAGTAAQGRAAAATRGTSRLPGATRRGVVGGMPRPVESPSNQRAPRGPVGAQGVTNSGRTGSANTARGVVGGKPVNEADTAKGSRVPRGPVIGGESATTDRPSGEKPGKRGVVGAPRGRHSNSETHAGQVAGRGGAARGGNRKQDTDGRRSRRDEKRDESSKTD
ncbi:WXG100 family type VII secretion target [Streptomyces sp. MS06]|uniref:WXG100 family type VII secretion target n=1 Tax=Streptomyces sp. MS06 TaxID=3385974 RepID=UPI0039A11B91